MTPTDAITIARIEKFCVGLVLRVQAAIKVEFTTDCNEITLSLRMIAIAKTMREEGFDFIARNNAVESCRRQRRTHNDGANRRQRNTIKAAA